MVKFVSWYVSSIGWSVSWYISYHRSGTIYSSNKYIVCIFISLLQMSLYEFCCYWVVFSHNPASITWPLPKGPSLFLDGGQIFRGRKEIWHSPMRWVGVGGQEIPLEKIHMIWHMTWHMPGHLTWDMSCHVNIMMTLEIWHDKWHVIRQDTYHDIKHDIVGIKATSDGERGDKNQIIRSGQTQKFILP